MSSWWYVCLLQPSAERGGRVFCSLPRSGPVPRVHTSHASSPPQITNTVPQKQHEAACSKIVTLDVSPTIAESIRRTHNGESISLLFGDWAEGVGVNGVGVY